MRRSKDELKRMAVAGVRARERWRLGRALEMGAEIRKRRWVGMVVMGGPMFNGRMVGANLYLEPGAARFDVRWNDGRCSVASRRDILKALEMALPRPRRGMIPEDVVA